MDVRLYNTLSRRTVPLVPHEAGVLRYYACGPTVYGPAHVGNFRSFIVEDLLYRLLCESGYQVTYVQNITDVGHLVGDRDRGEDKVAGAAAAEGVSAQEIVTRYSELFVRDAHALNIISPTVLVPASKHIPEQIAFIKKLEQEGFSYNTSDGVYFDTAQLPDYGALTHQAREELLEGARVEPNREKRNPTDFALWRLSPHGVKRQMEWDSPWGRGFPGWHIECSAISKHYLGNYIDIHAGGVDHVPIHHSNELAQNEAAGGPRVGLWFHVEFLLVEGKKMAKSLGNTYTVADIEERGFDPLAFRYLLLGTHYRQKQNFTWAALEAADHALERMRSIIDQSADPSPAGSAVVEPEEEWRIQFCALMGDDLNSPAALALLWESLRDDGLTRTERRARALYADRFFGLSLSEQDSYEIPDRVLTLMREREDARSLGNWELSDKLRSEIEDLGYLVHDTREGPRVRPIRKRS